jgi:hypothetical protein
MFQRPRVLPEAGYNPPPKLPAHGLAATDEAAALRAQLAALDAEAAEVLSAGKFNVQGGVVEFIRLVDFLK